MAGKFVHTMPPHHFELLRGEATDPKSYDAFGVNMIVDRSRELGVLKSKVLGSVSATPTPIPPRRAAVTLGGRPGRTPNTLI